MVEMGQGQTAASPGVSVEAVELADVAAGSREEQAGSGWWSSPGKLGSQRLYRSMSQKSNQDQTSVEWLEVRAIFERCTELPPEERETYLNTTLGARRDLRIQVERLLKKSEVAQGVMESPLLLALPSTGDVPFRPFRVGKYVLLRRLGSGGMAEVFLALSLGPESFERHLALKRILPFYSQEEEFRAFFVAEAKISSRLAHPNIVHVYDFFESNRSYFLSMEYVSGKNLGQVVGMLEVKGIQLPVGVA